MLSTSFRWRATLTRRRFSVTMIQYLGSIHANEIAQEVVGMAGVEEKAPRRMTCWNCRRYSRTEMRCREGKANPKRKSDSFARAEALDCGLCATADPYRDGLAMRMFFPGAPATILLSARKRRTRPRRLILDVIVADTPAADNTESG